MTSIIEHQGKKPIVHPTVFIAEGARVIGDVEIGRESSVWFNTVLRGDVNYIRVGERTNIQDNSTLHVTHKKYPCIVGSHVTIGHNAIVHACTVGDYCLIGMGSVILDNARIGPYSLVAAGSLVLEDFEVPEGTMVAGVPARVRRSLSDEEKRQLLQSAANYVEYAKSYQS